MNSDNTIIKNEKYLFWGFIGIVISFMIMGMSATGSKSLTNTFLIGKVCDVRQIVEKEMIISDKSSKEIIINLENEIAKWKYLYLNITASEKPIKVSMDFYKKQGSCVFSKDTELVTGLNKITLSGEAFTFIIVKANVSQNATLRIENAQVREKEKIQFQKEDILRFAFSLILYGILFFVISEVIKKNNICFYKIIEVLQDIYIIVGNSLLWMAKKIPQEKRALFRRFLVIFWMVYMMAMANWGKYTRGFYKYHIIVCCFILVSLIILMLENPLKRVAWKRTIVYYWLGLSVIMCISEYIYAKRNACTGYINIILFGFLYFVWNNMKDKNLFVRDIILALKWSFVPVTVFSLVFRAKVEGYGYAGPTWNPNIFAMYLVPVLTAILAESVELIKQKNNRKKLWLNIVLADMAIVFVLLTSSRIGVLMMGVIVLLFAIYSWRNILKEKMGKRLRIVPIMMILLVIPIYLTFDWVIVNVPQKTGIGIEFPADDIRSELEKSVATVRAAEKISFVDRIVYAPEVSRLLTGRNQYWMGYIREMNFLGHEFRPKMWNGKRTAHNGILEISYQYGVMVAVPYVFLFISGIYWSFFRLKKEKNGCSLFVFGIYVISLGFMLVENFERPFLATEWIFFYLLLGSLFFADEAKSNLMTT